MLSGNGTGGQQLVAPSAQQIGQVYQGSDKTLRNFMPAGGERNLALQQNQLNKASSIAGLYQNVQPYAAQQLASLAGVGGQLGLGGGSVGTTGFGDLTQYQSGQNAAKGAALGGIGQGLGLLGGAGIMHCWIAEVLYGAKDRRTLAIRSWLRLGKLPWHWKAFRFVYGKIGQKAANFLRTRPALQVLVRPLFDEAVGAAMRQQFTGTGMM